MRLIQIVVCIFVILTGVAVAGDPFNEARHAIGIKDNETVLKLIDSNQVPINMQNGEGYTLLHIAADQNNLEMVELLLARGANPSIKSQTGSTAFNMASGTVVRSKIKAAMDGRVKAAPVPAQVPAPAIALAPAATGAGDFDKIRHAIGIKDNDTAIAEINKGIDINAQTVEGYTLLHIAASQNNLVIVEKLLRLGALPNIRAQSGATAADLGYGFKPILAAIEAAGGRLNTMANAGKPKPMTPFTPAPTVPAAAVQPTSAANLCAQRHRSSSALCSDSTCKMREYRKWQTCLKTGSYY
ncbi:MAG: ankyrin repeat domain-containing protein [Telluria sp.]